MKWLIYLLVIANLTFFAWQYQKREATVARTADTASAEPAYVTRLLLLSEVGPAGAGGSPEATPPIRTPVPRHVTSPPR